MTLAPRSTSGSLVLFVRAVCVTIVALVHNGLVMESSAPLALYQQAIARQGYVSDDAQLRAVERLQRCHEALHGDATGESLRGVYLWGPVGRGKTWLMEKRKNMAFQ